MRRPDACPLTFLTFEPVTAAVLEERLYELFGHLLGPDPTVWPVVRGFENPAEADVQILASTAPMLIENAMDAGPLVYIQPEIMIVAEAFGCLWPDGPRHEAWIELRLLDYALRTRPVIRMEAVHGGGEALWSLLAGAIGLAPSPGSTPSWPTSESDVHRYDAALAALLAAGPCGIPSKLQAAGRFPVRAGGEGLRFLGCGWSHAEEKWTWSVGSMASLVIANAPSGPRTCELRGWLIGHPDRAVRLEVFLDRKLIAQVEGRPGHGPEVLIEFALPSRPTFEACVIYLLIRDPVVPADIDGGDDRRLLGVALSEIALLNEVAADGGATHAFIREPLVEQLLGRWTPRLTLVAAAEPAVAASVGEGFRRLGCPQILLVEALPPEFGAGTRTLPVATGVHVVDHGLAALGQRLQEAGARADLVVLCDPKSVSSWFDAVREDGPSSQALAPASLIINTGDPYICGLEFNAYASRWGALIQASDVVTIADLRGTP